MLRVGFQFSKHEVYFDCGMCPLRHHIISKQYIVYFVSFAPKKKLYIYIYSYGPICSASFPANVTEKEDCLDP